jgi:cell division protein FtsB
MTAIQRWMIGTTTQGNLREALAERYDDPSDQWCKAKDVAELERITATYLKLLSDKRTENESLKKRNRALALEIQTWRSDRAQLSNEVESLQTEVADLTAGDGL